MVSAITTSVIEEQGQERLEIDGAEMKVLAGADRGLRVALERDSLLIGSDPTCNVVLHDKTVSARHAEIVAMAKGYVVRDLDSTNGVLIGKQPVERAPLIDNMRIRLGDTTIGVKSLRMRHSIPLARAGEFGGMVAHSVKMRALAATLTTLAQAELAVLIEGETGTGKEVAARALHGMSSRARGPFVVFDCGAVSAALLASELFGHERGAFTGATETRPGLFEEADGGTLFLDEIGELPLELQPMLLGAIERKCSRRVGGKSDIRHDVRIVAATNRNLAEEVREGRFRQDLFYRLAAVRTRIPPLRERIEDIPMIANLFAAESATVITPETIALLQAYNWPGNVRELRNTIARLAVQPESAMPSAERPARMGVELPFVDERGEFRTLHEIRRLVGEQIERGYLPEVFQRAGGSVQRAAEMAGLTRQHLTVLAAKHNVPPRRRDGSND